VAHRNIEDFPVMVDLVEAMGGEDFFSQLEDETES
jgi:hypothetical protein